MFVLKSKIKYEHTERSLSGIVEGRHRGELGALTGRKEKPTRC